MELNELQKKTAEREMEDVKNLLLSFDLEEYEKAGDKDKAFEIGYKGGKIVQDLLNRIYEAVSDFSSGIPMADDLTIVVLISK